VRFDWAKSLWLWGMLVTGVEYAQTALRDDVVVAATA